MFNSGDVAESAPDEDDEDDDDDDDEEVEPVDGARIKALSAAALDPSSSTK